MTLFTALQIAAEPLTVGLHEAEVQKCFTGRLRACLQAIACLRRIFAGRYSSRDLGYAPADLVNELRQQFGKTGIEQIVKGIACVGASHIARISRRLTGGCA